MSNDTKDNSQPDAHDDPVPPDDEYGEVAPRFNRAVDYLETQKGHEATLRILNTLEQLVLSLKVLIEAKAQADRARPKLEFWKWVLLLIVRLAVFAVAVWALIDMRKVGTIDPAIALLVGGLVAYFFGYNKTQS